MSFCKHNFEKFNQKKSLNWTEKMRFLFVEKIVLGLPIFFFKKWHCFSWNEVRFVCFVPAKQFFFSYSSRWSFTHCQRRCVHSGKPKAIYTSRVSSTAVYKNVSLPCFTRGNPDLQWWDSHAIRREKIWTTFFALVKVRIKLLSSCCFSTTMTLNIFHVLCR